MSEYVTDPGTVPLPDVERAIVCSLMVAGSIALLNVIIMSEVVATFCAPLVGLVKITEGGVVSGGLSGPFLPQAVVKHRRRKTTLVMADISFKTLMLETLS